MSHKQYCKYSAGIQRAQFKSRRNNPLKQWKLSPLDQKAQDLWDDYTQHKERMFGRTHTSYSPWIIVQANNKRRARLESMRYVLSNLNYKGHADALTTLIPDPNVVMRFHRSAISVD